MKFSLRSILALFLGITSFAVFAQETNEELAKIAQNPLGNIMSFPFQNNTNFNYGPYKRVQDILNIQPILGKWGEAVPVLNQEGLTMGWKIQYRYE